MSKNYFILPAIFFLSLVFQDIYAQNLNSSFYGTEDVRIDTEAPSEAELTKFVATLKEVNKVKKEFDDSAIEKLEKSGLSISRFSELEKAYNNPSVEVNATAVEKENFETLIQELTAQRYEMEDRLMKAVEDNGLEINRYQEIMSLVKASAELSEKVNARL